MNTMPFGRYKGRPLSDLPLTYIRWLRVVDVRDPLLRALKDELKRRKNEKRRQTEAAA